MKTLKRKFFKQQYLTLFFLLLPGSKMMAGDNFLNTEIASDLISVEKYIYIDGSVKGMDIAKITSENSGAFQSFQLFSHGRPGELLIDGEWKDVQEIVIWLQYRLKTLSPRSINIYGCRFAESAKGRQAMAFLQNILRVPIAASSNITGRGGDWVLEAGPAINTISMPCYSGNLQQCALFGKGPDQDYDCDAVLNKDDLDKDNDGIINDLEAPIRSFRLYQPGQVGVKIATAEDPFTASDFDLSKAMGLPTGSVLVTVNNGHHMEHPAGTKINEFSAKRGGPTRFNLGGSLNVAVRVIHGDHIPGNADRNTQDGMVSDGQMSYTSSTATGGNLSANLSFIDYMATALPSSVPDNPSIMAGRVYAVKNSSNSEIINASGSFRWTSKTDSVRQFRIFTNASGLVNHYYEIVLIYQFLDSDNDGISNEYDLDSDGDGCPDAIEGEAGLSTSDISDSQIPGGNSGAGYKGTYNGPVTANLRNISIQPNGICSIVRSGQNVGMSQDNGSFGKACDAFLPVTLLNFSATVVEKRSVKLYWQTATEINNKFFMVERSNDAVTWVVVATRDGGGNSSSTRSYSVIDPSPLNGLNYYRLKQVDRDGHFTLSAIVTVKTGLGHPSVIISPNLITDGKISIRLSNELTNRPVIFELLNMQGQRIQQWSKQKAREIEHVLVSKGLPSAIYLFKTIWDGNVTSEKIVMVK